MKIIKKLVHLSGVVAIVLFSSSPAKAGFLDMPEIREILQQREQTMVRDLDIPALRFRNPDPNAGPRLAVSTFRIQGLVEFPELGITREAIQNLVEKIRSELMGEGKLMDSGYTIDELAQLSDLLVEIEDQTLNRHVTPVDLQKVVWLIRDQRSKRGITLGQIEGLADKITKFYREKGFILAKAYIPKQEVRDGVVTLTLLLGLLGDVKINNNTLYATASIKGVFDDMLTKPVTNAAIDEYLYLINDYPGISVDGFFEPGYQVGDTLLNVNIKDEKKYTANLRIDNHGTKETGATRLYADGTLNNLLGNADALSLSLLQSTFPANTTYYRIGYYTNVFSPKIKFSANISKNQFVLDQSISGINLGLGGTVDVTDAAFKYVLRRSKQKNYNIELKYENFFSDLQIGDQADNGTLDEKLQNISLIYNYDVLNEASKILHQGNVKLASGVFLAGADTGQDENYYILSSDYRMLRFVKVPFSDSISRLILRSNISYSPQNLSSILKFSTAGPTRVRAYSQSLFSSDVALFAGMDWVFNSPDFFNFSIAENVNFKEITKPFVFLDYAYGIQHPAATSDPDLTGQVAGVGFGFQFAHKNIFQGNLQFAFPLMYEFSKPDVAKNIAPGKIIFDFQYSF